MNANRDAIDSVLVETAAGSQNWLHMLHAIISNENAFRFESVSSCMYRRVKSTQHTRFTILIGDK